MKGRCHGVGLRVLLVTVFLPAVIGELSPSEVRTLHRLRRVMEHPPILAGWNRSTDFCSIVSDSVLVACSGSHVSEMAFAGGGASSPARWLSQNFSIDSLFAAVAELPQLKKLSLVFLGIRGPMPEIAALSSLQVLNLSSNYISGKVPEELAYFDQLRRLDIAGNKFAGHIPAYLFSLPSIEYVTLARNQFSGVLQSNTSCGGNLRFVDVSDNLLLGELPPCIGSNRSGVTALYSGNCFSSVSLTSQHPVMFCHREALAVKPPEQHRQDPMKKIEMIAGIVAAVGGGVGVLAVICLLIRRSKTKAETRETFVQKSSTGIDERHVPRTVRSAALGFPPYRVFAMDEIEDAIGKLDYSALVEKENGDHHSQVYRGRLRDGTPVAVKSRRWNQKICFLPQSLLHFVEAISKLRHQNLVSVIGHCIMTDEEHVLNAIFIVLEDTSTSSLRDHLADVRNRESLNWHRRITMAIGIARGIQFLHAEISPGIFGNNLKSNKILLDDNLIPKISDYRFPPPSRTASPSRDFTTTNWTNSFENEEEKQDVYDLGMILLEITTGRAIESESEKNKLKKQLERGSTEAPSTIGETIDHSLRGTYAHQSLITSVDMTVNCLNKNPSKRPTIEDVVWNLKYALQVQEAWSSGENLPARNTT